MQCRDANSGDIESLLSRPLFWGLAPSPRILLQERSFGNFCGAPEWAEGEVEVSKCRGRPPLSHTMECMSARPRIQLRV